MTKQRPTVVTAACVLMFAIAALSIASAAIGVIMVGRVRDSFLENAGDLGVDQQFIDAMASVMTITAIATAVVQLLIAIGYGILGIFNLRGKNGVRIATWVVSGLFLLCGICGAFSTLAGFTTTSDGTPETERLNQAMQEAIPAWYNTLSLVLTLISVFGYIAVIVLLALPAANEFFRPAEPQWEPPAEFGGQSGVDPHQQSGQPPYGQPPAGQPPYGQPPAGQPPYGQPPSGPNPPQY